MIRTKAYKVKDVAEKPAGPAPETLRSKFIPNIPSLGDNFDFRMIGGLVEDFGQVTSALKAFPYRSAASVAGFLAVVFVAFKIGRSFGIMQSNIKRKLKGK